MSKPGHHVRQELCLTRAPYREGRKPTAVKVYTVNQESKHLIVQGVPSIGAKSDLMKLFSSHGDVDQFKILSDYPSSESFTAVYLISYRRIQSARVAKRRLDDWSFFGGVLHICYAPEYETAQETREKLQERRRTIAAKIKQYNRDGTYSKGQTQVSTSTPSTDSIPETQGTPDSRPVDIRSDNIHARADMNTIENQGEGQRSCHNGVTLKSDGLTFNSPSPSMSDYQHINTTNNAHTNAIHNRTNVMSSMGSGTGHFSDGQFSSGHLNGQSNQGLPANQHSVHIDPQGQGSRSQSFSQLHIPPPPRESNINMHNTGHQNGQNQNYGFARVRSSQAIFPPNFDARLVKPTVISAETEEQLKEPAIDSDENGDNDESKTSEVETVQKEPDKTMQEKINENLKRDNVVIKDFAKKGTVPKFIPRQMQAKKKTVQGKQTKSDSSDAVSEELRRNAFVLRKVQGPEDIQGVTKEGPELQISSVEKSVKEIRKHVTQFSDRSVADHPAKRKKTTDS